MAIRSETEKDEYYRYGIGVANWIYKEPDVLSPDVVELMKREGVDKDYRFVWMGAAVVRVHGNTLDKNPVIKGDPRACVYRPMEVVLNGVPQTGLWLQPKDLFVRAAHAGYWYWVDDDGVRHTAEREDRLVAPPNKPIARQDLLWDLGHLVWSLQYRVTGELGVQERLWSPADAPGEYWQTIKTFRSRTNGYLAPTVVDVENMILKREHENRHLSKTQMREIIARQSQLSSERFGQHRAALEAEDKSAWDAEVASVIADNERQTAYGGRAQRRL